SRCEASHKVILLLHDTQAKPVEALPYLLRELKRRGYRVVHVVPAAPDRPKTATEPGQWMMHARLSPRTPIFTDTEPELPAPNPASFGFDTASNWTAFLREIPFVQGPARRPRALLARGRDSVPPVSAWPHGVELAPELPSWSGRAQTPAPSPQGLGYAGDVTKPWVTPKALIDGVAEARGAVAVDEIQRLLESLPE